mgnify:CR=1 FL=1
MALSGTVAFRPDVEEVITEAYERCGIDPQTRTGDQAVSARRSRNNRYYRCCNKRRLNRSNNKSSYNIRIQPDPE